MKIKNITIVFLSLFFFILACSDNNKKEIDINNFSNSKVINAKKVNWIKPYMPMGMLNIDSLLIIINYQGKKVFQIYNTKTKTLINECGEFGRGPNEFEMLKPTGQIIKENAKRFFYAYTPIKKLLFSINIDSLIAGKISFIDTINLTTRYSIQTHLIRIDSLLIGISDETKGKNFVYNINNNNITLWDYYPIIDEIEMLNNYEKYVLFARMWVYNNKRNLIAGAYNTYFNKLVYYDLNGNLIKAINLPEIDNKLKIKNFLSNVHSYSTGIINTGEHIYLATYPVPYKNTKEKYKSVLNIFDWSGNPIKQYLIKNALIRMFVVDKLNNKVYAYCPEDPDLLMVEFNLD